MLASGGCVQLPKNSLHSYGYQGTHKKIKHLFNCIKFNKNNNNMKSTGDNVNYLKEK